ncbi:DUF6701 domain-containing protein [Calditerrivibrio nitroreducens]|uniref:DUF6701 domain-containing protein n=1 Tax=Calditerrivibrio nitroreducens TaxID=477976 RepID=UPI003C716B74
MKRIILVLLLLFSIITQSFGADRYVGRCGSPYYNTIRAAITAASNGDTIKICDGIYNEAITINKGLTITSASGDRTKVTIRSNNNYSTALITTYASITISNIKIENSGNGNTIRLNTAPSNPVTFDNLELNSNGQSIYVASNINSSITIKNSIITSNRSIGIYFNNILNNGIIIDNVSITSYNNGIYFNNTINNGVTIKNSKITSLNNQGIYFRSQINGEAYFDNITVSSKNRAINLNIVNGKAIIKNVSAKTTTSNATNNEALYVSGTLNNGITINNSIFKSSNGKAAVFTNNIWGNGLSIDSSQFIAYRAALELASSRNYNPVITNSYFESKTDTALNAILANWTKFYVNNSCFKTSSTNINKYGLNLSISNSNDVHINNNCFYAPTTKQLAISTTAGYDWSGNYWENNIGVYNQNKVYDGTPLSSCQSRCSRPKPIVEYRMDECSWNGLVNEVKDSSGNNLHGQAKNNASTKPDGVIYSTGYFQNTDNGNNSNAKYVIIPDNDLLSPLVNTKEMTISAWIKPTSYPIGSVQNQGRIPLVAKGEMSKWEYALYLYTDGRPGVSVWHSGGAGIIEVAANTTIPLNQWSHITAVVKFEQNLYTAKIYVNGIEKYTSSPTSSSYTYSNTSSNLYIATRGDFLNPSFRGYIDEVKIFDYALIAGEVRFLYDNEKQGKNWDGSQRVAVNCLQLNECFFDDFNRSSLGSKWTIIKDKNFTPKIDNNKLILTDLNTRISSAVMLSGKIPSAENYLEIEFEHNAYGSNGNGADGITIALADAAVVDRLLRDNISDIAGGYGGSLGYAQRSGIHGFRGGWLGIGIDEYGNFANDNEGRGNGCTVRSPNIVRVPDSVTIRGQGDNETGYCYISNSNSLTPGIDNTNPTNYKYRIKIDTRNSKTFIKVERDILDGNGYTTIIDWIDATQNAIAPEYFKLSITGSTGAVKNIHTIDNILIKALSCGDLGREGFKYLLIDTPASALTCQAANVIVTACTNDDCSQKYTNGVSDIILSATNGASWLTNPINISSGNSFTTTGLRKTEPGPTTLSIISANPSPSDTPIYKCSWNPNCVVTFYDSGFVFDIPDNYSCKPQDITIKAVRKDDTSQRCIPAFQNKTIPVNFSYNYLNPPTNQANTKPVINGTPLNNSINLNFDNNGQATFNFSYNDAGQIGITAMFDNGTVQAVGYDNTTMKPFGFYIYTTDSNGEAENGANSTVFKKAGEEFNLSARAVCWESDTDTDLSNNSITYNYQKNNATVSHTLVSPAGGNNGTIGITSLNFTNGVASVDNQKFSEVGIIKFTVTDNDYLGTGSITGTSANIGRFIPDHFELTESFIQKYTSDFVYMENPFELKYTMQAKNRDNNITLNYTGDFAKGIVELFAENNYNGNNLIGRFTPAISSSWLNGSYSFFDNVTFSKDSTRLSSLENFRLGVKVNDPDGPILINRDMKPGTASCIADCEYKIIDNSTRILNAILDIQNAYGPVNYPLTVPAYILYYDQNGKLTINAADNKTTFTTDNITFSNWTQNLRQGDTEVIDMIKKANGYFEIKLKAPGANKNGSVTLNLSGFDFLKDTTYNKLTEGIATFGIFGNQQKRLYWKEVPAR